MKILSIVEEGYLHQFIVLRIRDMGVVLGATPFFNYRIRLYFLLRKEKVVRRICKNCVVFMSGITFCIQ